MKRELRETEFRKKLDSARTARKHLLERATPENLKYTKSKLRGLKRSMAGLRSSWILDGYTKDIISRFTRILMNDINDLSFKTIPS